MNKILKLKGQFKQRNRVQSYGLPHLANNCVIDYTRLLEIADDLKKCRDYWKDKTVINDALISVKYVDLISKSRRISKLFDESKIVGVKFNNEREETKKHIITYYVAKEEINKAIDKLYIIAKMMTEILTDGKISNKEIDILDKTFDFKNSKYKYSKSTFFGVIVDASNIDEIYVDISNKKITERSIVSLYETEKDTKELLNSIGIDISDEYIRNTTLLITPSEYDKLQMEAPYLIAMDTVDWTKIPEEHSKINSESTERKIIEPEKEAIIGVIDTPFDDRVYFSKWVESKNYVEGIINENDYIHGTGVTSIIVDGPSLNPWLDDGCGRFKVRHFGVATGGRFSSFLVMKKIEEIVKENTDIKVWNLSLGSMKEIENNFISQEGAILDEIQAKYDVIFVIAGTNAPANVSERIKIGAPADSINSIVVNPVDVNGNIASYAREGEVLSFYIKPDVCCFAGDRGFGINVCNFPNSEYITSGTSYAAPWITRKVAYLIYILGFTREEAKAIIIDSCEEWNTKYTKEDRKLYGHGIVPKNIKDVVTTKNDEIKFVISGTSIKYDTYNYTLPVPMHNGKYPYVAKATMCYFPKCSRNQGVDYTNTEFELKIGRLNTKNEDGTYRIKSINNDTQNEGGSLTTEQIARNEYRKWDNTKCIKEKVSGRSREKKAYDNPLWGISITTINRSNPRDGDNLKFGIVITLKEIHGNNRIDEFIQMCSYNQWFVEEVNVDNQIEIYNDAETDIDFNNK